MTDTTGGHLWRTMIYRAHKRDDGVVVCVDADSLSQTTKIVNSPEDLSLALSLGWSESPQEAMAKYEREQEDIGERAVQRVKEDRHLSEAAHAEAEAYEATTSAHVTEIPNEGERTDAIEAAPKRRRGRPRKVE